MIDAAFRDRNKVEELSIPMQRKFWKQNFDNTELRLDKLRTEIKNLKK